jgi:hypothetical protein
MTQIDNTAKTPGGPYSIRLGANRILQSHSAGQAMAIYNSFKTENLCELQ